MIRVSNDPPMSEDALIVLALAETAVSFAASPEDEAERWLRVMRLHGEVGCALQALGVPEGPLETIAHAPAARRWRLRTSGEDPVDLVTRRAAQLCRVRGAALTSTVDVLQAVLHLYGGTFDRALYERGTTRDEVLERLATQIDRRQAETATPI